ncbi:T7SS effector LXG polymorphic toxin [Bacillus pseudomycoides]|uniref:Cytoplasmic protein n=1 Tax=Bacillus pseudomycoides TaxID=64104 RepID=A0A2B5HIV2_9BACI|nr:T7SS effector LXG polymorphic toxin [Bacillus pseudomycoides]PEA83763.1 cytoplasmic protein [Bacillus pseudomycoides]PED69988.1 cytoplasmic protein [Bacillus pseudomycoides]PEI41511.1 cytoplasmic protein [Bacillus pseudomycoides]PEJ69553.1 cytoplasmic protein [Bacillus pseudomycoides]PEM12295.1 cytoplasmic protein [Bacillus pseudomycoides]
MSLNMYPGEVHTQTQSMNAICTATIQGMEQVIQSIDAFAIDTVLHGQTYDSAKTFFAETFRPLAQGIIYLCEELIRQNDAFPSQFQSKVASTDVIEQEILEQIQGIDQTRANMEAISQTVALPGTDAMMGIFDMMKRKLQEKLEHLHEFNYTSSSNYDTALQLAASIATGLAEVQSGKGFSPASGTFSTQGLNMEWAASIQAIEEDRKRQADNSIEEGAMCGKLTPKSDFEKAWERDKKDLIDAWTGISTGFVDGAEDAWEGFVALGDKETWLNMRDAIVNYDETLPAMWNTFSDSFINNFWNGDMESRMHYAAYGITSLGVGLLGDKGLSKAGQVGKVAVVTGFTKGKSLITNSATYRNTLNSLNNFNFNFGNQFSFAGIGGSSLKSSFVDTYQTAKDKLSPYQYTKSTTDGDAFVGKLYGKDVSLKDVRVDEITYTKRPREEFEQLRKAFDSGVRKEFLKSLVNDPVKLTELKKAGITDGNIELMKQGRPPVGWQVHHNLPLDDGGTNAFENLTLIENHPYHKAITNTQRTLTRHLQDGDSADISWPIPKYNIYPKGE